MSIRLVGIAIWHWLINQLVMAVATVLKSGESGRLHEPARFSRIQEPVCCIPHPRSLGLIS
jgi:hypothetical protein